MADREFSDSTKYEVVMKNLEENKGSILCANCKKKINAISECHFDHIFPYAKGGKSTTENCQILCVQCNLKKNAKMLEDFLLEEKARKFLKGESIDECTDRVDENVSSSDTIQSTKNSVEEIENTDAVESIPRTTMRLTKDEFDKRVSAFIQKKGDIHKVDFTREYNNLPSIWYVKEFYGGMTGLQEAFGLIDISNYWNRETIKTALQNYVLEHGTIKEKDLKKKNKLPSYPCIMANYPEYKTLNEIKSALCGLAVPEKWTVELAIEKGKEFVQQNGKIGLEDLKSQNGLPSNSTVMRMFGSLQEYQKSTGSVVTYQNLFIKKEDIKQAVNQYFKGKERVIESRKEFEKDFLYSLESIYKRYSSFTAFCEEEGITVLNTKKARYTKREVDDAVLNWVKKGNDIPSSKELSKLGLPSMSVILKYYEDWKEPFVMYKKLHEEVGRV